MLKVFLVLFTLLFASQAYAVSVVVAGVVAGIGAGIAGATLVGAIAVGALAAASSYLTMRMAKVPTPSATQQELKQTIRSARSAKQVTYGKTYRSGAMVFAEEQVGDKKNDDGTYNEWLYMVIAMCAHPIHKVLRIDFNETPISEFDGFVEVEEMNNPTKAPQHLLDNAPSWQGDMIGRGSFSIYCAMRYDRNKFANGVPTIRVEFEGKKDIWDMRDDSVGYTNNAALVIADYFISYRGYSRDRIITEGFGSFVDAANLCDEQVENPDGSFSKRYEINGTFQLDEKPAQALSDLLSACGGQLVRLGDKIGLLPAAYYGVASFTLTDSDISDAGDLTIQPEVSFGESVNTVKGTFVDPNQDYSEIEYPHVIDENALLRDGIELSADLNFRFVSDVYQAQRLASIYMRKQNSGGTIGLTTNLNGLYCRLGRVIRLELESLGVSGEYRVVEQTSHLSGGIQLSLASESIDIYDDAVGDQYVPPPLTNLPIGVSAPSNVRFIVESIGDVVQGMVTWEINDPQSTSTEIRFKNESGVVVQDGVSSRDTYKVNGLVAGNYTVEVRTVTSRAGVSNWAAAIITVSRPPQITRVDLTRSNWSIELIPVIEGGAPSGTLFEFLYLADNESFISGVPNYDESDIALARSIFTGSSLNHTSLIPDRYQHYWVRSVNSYGKSEFIYIKTGTTRESDLVTFAVERLEAIEIQSANWDDEADTGYKLFSNASDPYEMPDGTVLENPDGLLVANNAVIRGNINADQLHFSEASKELSELGLVQLSGGGFKSNPLQGWGITQSGLATFNGGVTARGATIVGGTIIGAQIVAGEIVYSVDYDTDGLPDGLVYRSYPEIPVTAGQDYTSQFGVVGAIPDEDRVHYVTGDFAVVSCSEVRGDPDQNRFRWGKIRKGAMRVFFDTDNFTSNQFVTSKEARYAIELTVQMLNHVGQVTSQSEPTVFANSNEDQFITHKGVSWVVNMGSSPEKITIQNDESFFGSLSEDSFNGRVRMLIKLASTPDGSWDRRSRLNWGGQAEMSFRTTVNNTDIPL